VDSSLLDVANLRHAIGDNARAGQGEGERAAIEVYELVDSERVRQFLTLSLGKDYVIFVDRHRGAIVLRLRECNNRGRSLDRIGIIPPYL
jgi:hypothetical protein